MDKIKISRIATISLLVFIFGFIVSVKTGTQAELDVCCKWDFGLQDSTLTYSFDEGTPVEYIKFMAELTSEWERALDAASEKYDLDEINFRYDEYGTEIFIMVYPIGEKLDFEGKSVAAYTMRNFDYTGAMDSVTIHLSQTDITGNEFDDVTKYNLFKHEIGHVLGLDHSDNVDSLMYKIPFGGVEYKIDSCYADAIILNNYDKHGPADSADCD